MVTLPVSRIGLVAAGAIFFANFAAYTYIGPLLHVRAGLGASAITVVLLGFGLAGVAGNFTAGVTVRLALRATLMGSGLLVAVSTLLLATVTGAHPLTITLVAVWGLGFGGGAGGRAELDHPCDACQRRRRPGPVRVGAARLAGRRLGGRRRDLRRQRARRRARPGRGRRGRWITHPAGPGRGRHQLSASGLGRTGSRARPGSAGTRGQARSIEQETVRSEPAEGSRSRAYPGRYQEGTAMPNAVVMTGYGPPEVLKWAAVPLGEPGEGQVRIKVKAAGVGPTDLDMRAGYLKDVIPLPPNAVLGFEAAGPSDAVGPGVTGTSIGDAVTALLFSLGGYAEYAVASIWTGKPDTVSWIDAAALPSSAEAAVGVLRQLNVTSGETLLLVGGGGSVGIIATQLAAARGVMVISAVGGHDETLARELGATPVRYGAGLACGSARWARWTPCSTRPARASWPTRSPWPADPSGSSPCRTRPLLTSASRCLSPRPTVPLVPWMRRSPCSPTVGSRLRAHHTMPMQQAAEAHRQLESGNVHERIILTLDVARAAPTRQSGVHHRVTVCHRRGPPGPGGWRPVCSSAVLRTSSGDGHVWLARTVVGIGRRQVPQQRAGQQVKQVMPGAEIGRGRPDAPARDELDHGGGCGPAVDV